MQLKTIGILGGLGPNASAYFLNLVLDICQKKYGAVQDYEYPNILLESSGIIGFEETGVTDEANVIKALQERVKHLAACGAQVIVIPCNTVHLYIEEMRSTTTVPIISITECTQQLIQKQQLSHIGLLSSQTTRDSLLYEDCFKKTGIGISTVSDQEQISINDVIKQAMGGNNTSAETAVLQQCIEGLKQRGVQAVILGCTELPLIIAQKNSSVPLINTMTVLAEAVTSFAYTDFQHK